MTCVLCCKALCGKYIIQLENNYFPQHHKNKIDATPNLRCKKRINENDTFNGLSPYSFP